MYALLTLFIQAVPYRSHYLTDCLGQFEMLLSGSFRSDLSSSSLDCLLRITNCITRTNSGEQEGTYYVLFGQLFSTFKFGFVVFDALHLFDIWGLGYSIRSGHLDLKIDLTNGFMEKLNIKCDQVYLSQTFSQVLALGAMYVTRHL